MLVRHGKLSVLIGEPWRQWASDCLQRNGIIQMSGKLTVSRRLVGIERINTLEVRRRGVQPPSVYDEVAVIANPNLFTPHGNHALDIELAALAGVHALNVVCFKDNDLPAFRPAKII